VFSPSLFYKNIVYVLQTVIPFVLCSCLCRSLPLEDGGGSELSLVGPTASPEWEFEASGGNAMG